MAVLDSLLCLPQSVRHSTTIHSYQLLHTPKMRLNHLHNSHYQLMATLMQCPDASHLSYRIYSPLLWIAVTVDIHVSPRPCSLSKVDHFWSLVCGGWENLPKTLQFRTTLKDRVGSTAAQRVPRQSWITMQLSFLLGKSLIPSCAFPKWWRQQDSPVASHCHVLLILWDPNLWQE